MACGNYSNHCNVAGYYSDSVSPFSHQNSDAYNHNNANACGVSYHSNNSGPFNWTNASECGGNYHVNHLGCYQDVVFYNWPDYSNTPFVNFTNYVNNIRNTCYDHHQDYGSGHTDWCDKA
jgi:hypothetical protein